MICYEMLCRVVPCQVGAEDEFLLLASDGVWDAMRPAEAVAFVRAELPLARKQCVRVLAENFGARAHTSQRAAVPSALLHCPPAGSRRTGSLHVDVLTSRDVSKYTVGEAVDFPKSRDKVHGGTV